MQRDASAKKIITVALVGRDAKRDRLVAHQRGVIVVHMLPLRAKEESRVDLMWQPNRLHLVDRIQVTCHFAELESD